MPYRVKPESAARRFWEKVNKTGPTMRGMDTPCWEWMGARSEFGHGEVRVGGRLLRAHRVAWERAHGPIPEGMSVLHRCDNPACVREEAGGGHLFLGTKADNTADMMAKGRGRSVVHRGEESGTAKFTNDQVREIRRIYAAGEANQYQLAAAYGVSQGTIGFIVRRETWTHL